MLGGRAYNVPIFFDPYISKPVGSCLVRASAVRHFVPESTFQRISSESDSAALAPLQLGFYLPVPWPSLNLP